MHEDLCGFFGRGANIYGGIIMRKTVLPPEAGGFEMAEEAGLPRAGEPCPGAHIGAGPQELRAQRKKEFLRGQNSCCVCGEPTDTCLEYIPKTRFAVENAQCLHCMTLVRVKNHSIQ